MATETDAARDRVLAARASLGEELEVLEASARAAVDVPAKIRRSPAKAAAIAGGTAFVVLGGPRRVLRRGQAGGLRRAGAACRSRCSPTRSRRPSASSAMTAPRSAARSSATSRPTPSRPAAIGRSPDAAPADRRPAAPVGRGQGGDEVAVPDRRRGVPGPPRRDPRAGDAGLEGRDADDGRGRHHRRDRASDRRSRPASALDFAAGEWRNGRRAGLRSRCRASGVEVRPLSRLQAWPLAAPVAGRRPYTSRAMQITKTPGPKSTVLARDRAPARARQPRHRRGRPAPRRGPASPASAPARHRAPSWSETSARARSSTTRSSTSSRTPTATRSIEEDILPLTNADVEIVQAEEGKPLIFKATVQVRPEVELGDYKNFNFGPEIETIDDARVEPGPRRAARPERDARRRRGPRREGRRLRGHLVRRDARRRAVRGRLVRADAADPRPGAADPGLRGEPRRARGRRHRPSSTSPSRTTTPRPSWPASWPISRSSCGSCARRSCPSSTTTSSGRSATSPTSTRCGPTSSCASSGTRSTGRATSSPTGSSSTRSPTRRSSCRTSWSTRRSR